MYSKKRFFILVEAKMVSFFENLHSVAASVNFCTVIHNQIGCKRGEDCYIGLFVNCLVNFLKEDRPEDETKGFLLTHCTSYKNLFRMMFNLSENRDDCFNFFQVLKEKNVI